MQTCKARMQSAHAEGTGGTARQTTTTASAARRVRAGHAHAPCLARVRRPEVVGGQARNAVLSERHARQARVVQLRRAVISTRRRVAAHPEVSAQQTQHGTDVSSARAAARVPKPSSKSERIIYALAGTRMCVATGIHIAACTVRGTHCLPPKTSRHAQKKTQKCSLAHRRTSIQHTHTRNRNPCLIRILESAYERAVHKKGGRKARLATGKALLSRALHVPLRVRASVCGRGERDRDIPEAREAGELGRRQARQPVALQRKDPVGKTHEQRARARACMSADARARVPQAAGACHSRAMRMRVCAGPVCGRVCMHPVGCRG